MLNARIDRVVFYNNENFYSILKCSDEDESFSVVGYIPNPTRGQEYDFDGEWTTHPKYGKQFNAVSGKLIMPRDAKAMRTYLRSGAVKGIGKVKADRIVDLFGEDTFSIFEETPERLIEVEGIGKKNVEKIINGWVESRGVREIVGFLQEVGAPTSLAVKIYKEYGSESVDVVRKNPYILADMWGVGFLTADSIALELGFERDNPFRIRSGIVYYLKKISMSGHCFERRGALVNGTAQLLGIPVEKVDGQLPKMTEEIVEEQDSVYLKPFFYAERGIAKKLYEIAQYEGTSVEADIDQLEESFVIRYDEVQREAIKNAVRNKVAVITGGPGTGKTTIIKAIVRTFKENNMKVVLASPTGRAAKRMSEVVGMEASTIHRLLEYNPMEEFQRNEENPIEGDALILDECSMIDVQLMYSLLKAVPEHMNLVMVGDVDQLPSVGPGNVLADIISSEKFYTARLETVFRQAEESDIIVNAHRINRGEQLSLRDRDVKFVGTKNIKSTILRIIENIDKRGFKPEDIMVLSPMKKSDVGTIELNNAIQDVLNKGEAVIKKKYVEYRIGDRVMQIRNNYDKEVFNGSLGVIKSYDSEDKILKVDFDGVLVEYDHSETDELMLAYAITIHKSQGSEFPVVIIPMTLSHMVMLQRNLIYTAFTRPMNRLYLVGEPDAVRYAIGNDVAMKRNTRLSGKIKKWFRDDVPFHEEPMIEF